MSRHVTLRLLAVGALFVLRAANTELLASESPYPTMASLDQYLMADRDAEIALARSAAPESISGEADVLILTRQGYETAVKGKNGFVCLVERGWMAPVDSPEFWNPKIRGADCYNPIAVRSMLPLIHKRTQMVLAGLPRAEIVARLKTAYAGKELRPPEPGAMTYMMSKQAYLTDDGSHNMAHVMIFTAIMSGTSWGADLPKSPIFVGVQGNAAEPFSMFVIAVSRWSDGTPVHAPAM